MVGVVDLAGSGLCVRGREVVCAKFAPGGMFMTEGKQAAGDVRPNSLEGGDQERAGDAHSRDAGSAAFRGEERSRHMAFSQAVSRALLGRDAGRIPRRQVRADANASCSGTLTAQELKFLLE